MGTITFSPPATREQFFRARDTLASAGGFFQWSGDTVVSMKAFEFPCDLTVDPTKPDTWVRAVYEAGKRDGVVEHVLVFCSHGCADTYYQSLQPQWKPSEKIDLNGVEYVPKVTPPA